MKKIAFLHIIQHLDDGRSCIIFEGESPDPASEITCPKEIGMWHREVMEYLFGLGVRVRVQDLGYRPYANFRAQQAQLCMPQTS